MSRLGSLAAAAVAALLLGALVLGPEGRISPSLAGTIQEGSFWSRAVNGTLHFSVYLPPQYEDSTTRYPVIYFLHGLPAS